MPCRATQDGRVIVESSNKMGSTGGENGKPLQYSCFKNPINSMKRQKGMTLKDELPSFVGAQYNTGEEWRNNSRKNEVAGPSGNDALLWICLVVKVKGTGKFNSNDLISIIVCGQESLRKYE